jgi:hypothetical protein
MIRLWHALVDLWTLLIVACAGLHDDPRDEMGFWRKEN